MRVGALSLTATRVTVMVVFWGGWLVGGGSGEGGVGEKEERVGGEGMNYKGRAVIYKHPCTKQGTFYTFHQTKPCLTCCTTVTSHLYPHLYSPNHTRLVRGYTLGLHTNTYSPVPYTVTRMARCSVPPPILTQPYPTGTRVHSRTAH